MWSFVLSLRAGLAGCDIAAWQQSHPRLNGYPTVKSADRAVICAAVNKKERAHRVARFQETNKSAAAAVSGVRLTVFGRVEVVQTI